MDEKQFLEALSLQIRAAYPLVFIQSHDEDWIIDALKVHFAIKELDEITDEGLKTLAVGQVKVALWRVSHAEALKSIAVRTLLLKRSKMHRADATLVVIGSSFEELSTELYNSPMIKAPLPTRTAREALIGKILAGHALDEARRSRIALVTAGLSRPQIAQILSKCLVEKADDPSFDAWEERIAQEKRQRLASESKLEIVEDSAGMEAVGGHEDLKAWLEKRRLAFGPKAQAFGIRPPRGLLLVGIQGCGKSLLAKAIAHTWRFPLLRLEMGAIFSSTNDSPDAALERALNIADAMAPVVICCDEIEKSFSGSGDPTTRRLLAKLLNWLQERHSEAFFIATANDIQSLPPELIRKGRFDEVFFVDLPDEAERIEIFDIHLKKVGRNPKQFDSSKFASESVNFSGAEIEECIASSLFTAFAQNRELRDDDIFDAIHECVPIYKQREDEIKELREWAQEKTRRTRQNAKILSYFN